MRKVFIILSLLVFLNSSVSSLYAYSQISAYLCEIGLKFYQQGKYEEALHEFKKALMAQPNYEPALKYIQMIEKMKVIPEKKEVVVPPSFKPTVPTPAGAIKELLDLIEIQREMIQERQLVKPELVGVGVAPVAPANILNLDESFSKVAQPIEIAQGQSIIIVGNNIQRFLVTQEDIITVEKKSPNELLVTGKDIGYTYLHVWDENDRWTTEFLTVFPKPEGPTYEELMRREEEKARNFKLRYTLDWSSYEAGRRIDDLERSSHSWLHGLTLTGPTPYGDIDSTVTVRRISTTTRTTTDLTYVTLGLSDGKIGPFKDFGLRAFEYSPPVYNLVFPRVNLRGAMFTSPIFAKKLDYVAFWGREGGGRYGNLSPGLTKTKNSFLNGFNLNYSPTDKQNYRFTLAHGWGRDRDSFLNHYGFDLISNWNFDKWGLGYEIAHDSEKFTHLLNTRITQPKLNLTAELRDIDKSFLNMTGLGWRQGELGGLFNLNYTPTDKFNMNTNLNVYQDRLYPALDNDDRWNEDFTWETAYRFDPLTSLNLNYTIQNDLGRLSQYRFQSPGLRLSRTFKLSKDIYTYINYNHQENKNFTAPSIDYINERVLAGIRFGLIGDLYYYVNKEINWLVARYTADHSQPNALETGLDYSGRIGKTPLQGNFRFTYRDEEDTVSPLSFLPGEDYIEGYIELSYRPASGNEIYGSTRVRNAWADNPSVNKRIEASFSAGIRYLWDTGVRWEAVGNVEGYVFKDLNSDGLRQRDEPPLEGIKVWLGKDKSQVTDIFGYYKFKGIKARRVYVTLDTSTLPSGFVLTVPVTQEVAIAHHRTARVYFGIISRSEISGIIFEDIDGNGVYSKDDKGIQNIVITLEDGKSIVTDSSGKYSFPNVAVGEHTITLDLNSLPVYYLPKTAIIKKITLFEGMTYIYNIPLKRIQE